MAFENLGRFDGKFVDANGLRTHYLDEGDGPPLVLIQGGGAGADSRSNFADNIDLYKDRFRVIVPDMLGFGCTEMPSPESFEYSQSARTKHMVAFVDALGLSDICIVGNSMGGTTAMGIALERPGLVQRMCLMAGAANVTSEDMMRNQKNVSALLHYDDTIDGMRRIIKALTYDFTPSEEFVKYRYEMSVRPEAKAAYKATMSWAGRNGLYFPPESFQALDMPVLVMCGRDDAMVPIEKNFEMMRSIPKCRGYVMSQCGHWCMVEHPEEFCDVTARFFLDEAVFRF